MEETFSGVENPKTPPTQHALTVLTAICVENIDLF